MVSCTYNTETLKDLTFVSNDGYTKHVHYTLSISSLLLGLP